MVVIGDSVDVRSDALPFVDILRTASGDVHVKFGETPAGQTMAGIGEQYTDFCLAVDVNGDEPFRKTFRVSPGL